MPRRTMVEAIRDAMDVSMQRDDNVVVFGEDVGYFGGVFRCTAGLQQKFGTSRCFDAPISELGIVGAAVGMAAYGLAARASRSSSPTICIRPTTRSCRRRRACATARTASSPRRWSCACRPAAASSAARPTARVRRRCSRHVAGLKTVVPSNPYDAKGLLIAAIEDDDPVIFLEPKRLYNGPFDGHHDRPVTPWAKHAQGEVPDGHYTVPLGKAAIRREGAAVTVLAYGTMVLRRRGGRGRDRHRCRDHRPAHPAAARPRDRSSPRSRRPGAASIVHEATLTCGFGAELAALVQEHCFYHLEAPIVRVDRLGHALSACPGMGLLPGPGARRPRALKAVMEA